MRFTQILKRLQAGERFYRRGSACPNSPSEHCDKTSCFSLEDLSANDWAPTPRFPKLECNIGDVAWAHVAYTNVPMFLAEIVTHPGWVTCSKFVDGKLRPFGVRLSPESELLQGSRIYPAHMFSIRERVRIDDAGLGTVVRIHWRGKNPEPQYLIELDSGPRVRIGEDELRIAPDRDVFVLPRHREQFPQKYDHWGVIQHEWDEWVAQTGGHRRAHGSGSRNEKV